MPPSATSSHRVRPDSLEPPAPPVPQRQTPRRFGVDVSLPQPRSTLAKKLADSGSGPVRRGERPCGPKPPLRLLPKALDLRRRPGGRSPHGSGRRQVVAPIPQDRSPSARCRSDQQPVDHVALPPNERLPRAEVHGRLHDNSRSRRDFQPSIGPNRSAGSHVAQLEHSHVVGARVPFRDGPPNASTARAMLAFRREPAATMTRELVGSHHCASLGRLAPIPNGFGAHAANFTSIALTQGRFWREPCV